MAHNATHVRHVNQVGEVWWVPKTLFADVEKEQREAVARDYWIGAGAAEHARSVTMEGEYQDELAAPAAPEKPGRGR